MFEDDEIAEANLVDSGYLPTGDPSPDGKLRLLNFWICRTCHHYNVGEVTFDGPRIVAIEGVPSAPASAERVQYIQRDVLPLVGRS